MARMRNSRKNSYIFLIILALCALNFNLDKQKKRVHALKLIATRRSYCSTLLVYQCLWTHRQQGQLNSGPNKVDLTITQTWILKQIIQKISLNPGKRDFWPEDTSNIHSWLKTVVALAVSNKNAMFESISETSTFMNVRVMHYIFQLQKLIFNYFRWI